MGNYCEDVNLTMHLTTPEGAVVGELALTLRFDPVVPAAEQQDMVQLIIALVRDKAFSYAPPSGWRRVA